MAFDFDTLSKKTMPDFAEYLKELQRRIGFKVSARGWCYQLEAERQINKDQFGRVENAINRCRELGYLPVDFVAEESARKFSNVETPQNLDMDTFFGRWIVQRLEDTAYYYTPDWWEDQNCYIQMLVEKIDLLTLFRPVCSEYHIPIATSKGWSSILQRAEYARRFKQAEERGLKCVLLYAGDFDPDGLRIADHIKNNLVAIQEVVWADGTDGYDPSDLEIHRFALTYDFIVQHKLTWIDNLITGSGGNLASQAHKNHNMEYVQRYLNDYGERKCEANSIIPIPQIARNMVRGIIEEYTGSDALEKFRARQQRVLDAYEDFKDRIGLTSMFRTITSMIENES